MNQFVPNVRQAEVIVAVVLAAVAGLVLWESVRLGSGWGISGPQPGFFPFWTALTMLAGVLIVLIRTFRRPPAGRLYESAEQAADVLRVGVPLAVAVFSVQYLGFYLMTTLYVAFFGIWFGRYRWYLAIPAGLLLAVVLFFTFERGFKIGLPKSVLYGDSFPL